MDLTEYFNQINKEGIENLIKERQEENLHIEFKTVVHPHEKEETRDFDKRNFSKCLSGFANSSGGLIIWGVNASPNKDGIDCANKLSPITQLNSFLNKLNRLEGQAVTPIIKGVRSKKIESSVDKGYIVTIIPESENSPHIANFADKYYYKRSGDSFYRAEHFDIVDMFSRTRRPTLDLQISKIESVDWQGDGMLRFEILFSIVNKSNTIAKFPYIGLTLSNPYSQSPYGIEGINGNRRTGLISIKNNIHYDLNYSGGQDIVVFPKSTLNVDCITGIFEEKKGPTDLIIEYIICAENMDIKKGSKKISKERLIKSR
ncbi:MAG: ATP-binding protein [Cyclobacteriaceae bacterium]|nr:ATP-binding protein [Cyclobacteriaceae bacterium]